MAPRTAGGSGSATVTWKPDVHVIELDTGYAALISVSTDGSTLVFDRSIGNIPEMKAGDVFVVKGLLARKVVAAMTNGNELAVLTIPAALLDLVTDAKIHVESQARGQGPFKLIVNDTTTEVPVLEATLTKCNELIRAMVLDAYFPMMLDYYVPARHFHITCTKVSYPTEHTIDQHLAKDKKVDLYDGRGTRPKPARGAGAPVVKRR